MKKQARKKKTKTSWSMLGLILLLIFVLISGYGLVKLYNGLRYPATVVHAPTPDEINPGPGDMGPGEIEQIPLEPDPVQLYQIKLEELQARIKKTDSGLRLALQQFELRGTEESSEPLQVEIFDGLFLNVEKRTATVQIIAGTTDRAEVKSALRIAAEQVGSKLLRVVEAAGKDPVEELVFGFVEGDFEVVTHQFRLKQIPFVAKARLAFIIDDLGYEKKEFERMMTIPRPMTFAVIPHLPKSVQQARRVWEEGYDLILHQPMEAAGGQNPGEGALYTSMSEDQIIETLSANLASLPQGLIGSNNHMGSKATADPRVMQIVLDFFKERGMFFVDSSTAPDSVVSTVATQVGIKYAENRIFIDNVDELEPIKEQIMKAARIALRDGSAITIGHVRNYTARAILESIPELERMGVQLVYAKELLLRP